MLTSLNSRTALLLFCLVVLLALSAGRARADDEYVWAALKQGGKRTDLAFPLLALLIVTLLAEGWLAQRL